MSLRECPECGCNNVTLERWTYCPCCGKKIHFKFNKKGRLKKAIGHSQDYNNPNGADISKVK